MNLNLFLSILQIYFQSSTRVLMRVLKNENKSENINAFSQIDILTIAIMMMNTGNTNKQ